MCGEKQLNNISWISKFLLELKSNTIFFHFHPTFWFANRVALEWKRAFTAVMEDSVYNPGCILESCRKFKEKNTKWMSENLSWWMFGRSEGWEHWEFLFYFTFTDHFNVKSELKHWFESMNLSFGEKQLTMNCLSVFQIIWKPTSSTSSTEWLGAYPIRVGLSGKVNTLDTDVINNL